MELINNNSVKFPVYKNEPMYVFSGLSPAIEIHKIKSVSRTFYRYNDPFIADVACLFVELIDGTKISIDYDCEIKAEEDRKLFLKTTRIKSVDKTRD